MEYVKALPAYLLTSSEALKTAIRSDGLHIIDCARYLATDSLGALSNSHASMILKWWTDLAAAVGLTELTLRQEDLAKQKRLLKKEKLVCSWYKCLRYDHEVTSSPLFLCAGCDDAMYCGTSCQDR